MRRRGGINYGEDTCRSTAIGSGSIGKETHGIQPSSESPLTTNRFNIGDALDKPLAEQIGTYHKILGCGTVLMRVKEGIEVWGTGWDGFRDLSDRGRPFVKALRGPLTGAAVDRWKWKNPGIYGDPAILLPKYWKVTEPPIHEIGWIPHFKDTRTLDGAYLVNVKTTNVKAFVHQISRCKAVFSSSLHGLIIADAYGIPSCWVDVIPGWKHTAELKGEPWKEPDRPIRFKYDDYYAGIGVECDPVQLGEGEPKLHPIPDGMAEDLLRVCPWRS